MSWTTFFLQRHSDCWNSHPFWTWAEFPTCPQLRLTLSCLLSEWGWGGWGSQTSETSRLRHGPSDLVILHPLFPHVHAGKSGLCLAGWVGRITPGNPSPAMCAAPRHSKSTAPSLLLLFCLFYCERGVVKSSKEWSTLHQGRHTRHHRIVLVALLSPFMEVEKRMRNAPAFLGSCGTAGNRLASGISVHGWFGGVSAQVLGDWAD